MKTQKIIAGFALSLLLIGFVAAYSSYSSSWGGRFSDFYFGNLLPYDLLNNPWTVFIGVFLIAFSLVYVALFKVFLEKTGPAPQTFAQAIFPPKNVEGNKGPIIAISLVVAFFIAAAVSQQSLLYGYLGESISSWILFMVLTTVTAFTMWGMIAFRGFSKVLSAVFALIMILIWGAKQDSLPYIISEQMYVLGPLIFWILIGFLIVGLIIKIIAPARAGYYHY